MPWPSVLPLVSTRNNHSGTTGRFRLTRGMPAADNTKRSALAGPAPAKASLRRCPHNCYFPEAMRARISDSERVTRYPRVPPAAWAKSETPMRET